MKRITVISLILGMVTLIFSFRKPKTPEEDILRIVSEYQNYELVDSEYQYTIALCEPMVSGRKIPNNAYQNSVSRDPSTHGDKMYRLFVKDIASYPDWEKFYGELDQPVGQVMVKESWEWDTVQVSSDSDVISESIFLGSFRGKSRYLVPQRKSDLFILYKSGKQDYKTDKGWIYGIYSSEKKKVLEAGVIKNCQHCHEKRPDHTFGINFW